MNRALKQAWLASQNHIKQYVDGHQIEHQFEGDLVLFRLQHYPQVSIATRSGNKLLPKFYEPYQIEKKISVIAYRLQLPPKAKMHPVFNVFLLKKYYPGPTHYESDLTKFAKLETIELEEVL